MIDTFFETIKNKETPDEVLQDQMLAMHYDLYDAKRAEEAAIIIANHPNASNETICEAVSLLIYNFESDEFKEIVKIMEAKECIWTFVLRYVRDNIDEWSEYIWIQTRDALSSLVTNPELKGILEEVEFPRNPEW